MTKGLQKRFYDYHNQHLCWGSLHIVLDDLNIEDDFVVFCIKYAAENNDPEGEFLARELLKMTEEQRLVIARM